MKKNELKRLALLGMAAGALMANQPVQASENGIDIEHMIAKPKCKAHGGCGGLTASRDLNNAAIQNDEELDGEDEDVNDINKNDAPKASTTQETPKEIA